MKTLVFAIAAVMVSGSMAFAAINDQSVSQQPVNEPDTTEPPQNFRFISAAGAPLPRSGARLSASDPELPV